MNFFAEEIENRKALGQPDIDYHFHFEVFNELSKKIELSNEMFAMIKVGFAMCKETNADTQKAGEIFDYLIKNPGKFLQLQGLWILICQLAKFMQIPRFLLMQ